ncbi:hypothetical protein M9Y10_012009 [Tritrichomonas musculus]|uniref:Uncharacterized protein n=1 Tax=Tritrichomonas musculus TaxID=1915356 RepID=A0ABR2ICQ3_9EUKA
MQNQDLEKILYKFKIKSYSNFKEDLFQSRNELKIIIIDEYKEGERNKYFFVCFDHSLFIFSPNQEENSSFPSNFISIHKDSTIYFLKDNKKEDCKFNNFLKEISNFSKQFSITNTEYQSVFDKIKNSILD